MTTEVIIRELIGLEEILATLPLVRQSNSTYDEPTFRERIEAMLAQGGYRCIAAYHGYRMVGVSGFWTGTQLWCGRYVEADHVVVDSTMRSLGIGAQLMNWIAAEGERLECHVMRIAMILGRERTHNFYSRLDFCDDGLVMVKPLSRGEAMFPEYVVQREPN